jgi:hypothetical protein
MQIPMSALLFLWENLLRLQTRCNGGFFAGDFGLALLRKSSEASQWRSEMTLLIDSQGQKGNSNICFIARYVLS